MPLPALAIVPNGRGARCPAGTGRRAGTIACAGVLAVLGGCVSPWDPGTARIPAENATDYAVSLMETYADLAAESFDRNERRDADFFLGQAATAANGDDVVPLDPAAFRLTDTARTEIAGYRDRLGLVLRREGRTRAPAPTGQARAYLDCLIDARAEAPDDHNAGDCLVRLKTALTAAEEEVSKRRLLVVVLPEADGAVGAVTVNYGDGQTRLLDDAHAAVRVDDRGRKEDIVVTATDVAELFNDTLAAQPKRPAHFTLYFIAGSDEMTARSRAEIETVFAEIDSRTAYEVEVIGHTDAQGPTAVNARLSRERANAIRSILIDRGVPSADIIATGRGEREPTVPGASSAQPMNRRVEITVR